MTHTPTTTPTDDYDADCDVFDDYDAEACAYLNDTDAPDDYDPPVWSDRIDGAAADREAFRVFGR